MQMVSLGDQLRWEWKWEKLQSGSIVKHHVKDDWNDRIKLQQCKKKIKNNPFYQMRPFRDTGSDTWTHFLFDETHNVLGKTDLIGIILNSAKQSRVKVNVCVQSRSEI